MNLKEQLIDLLETEKLKYIIEYILKHSSKLKGHKDIELQNLINKINDIYYELGKISMIKSNRINLQSTYENIIDICLFIEYCEKENNINTLNELYNQYKLEQTAFSYFQFNAEITQKTKVNILNNLNNIITNHNFLYNTMIKCNNKIGLYSNFIDKVMNDTLGKYTETLKSLLKNLIIECNNHIESQRA